MIRKLALGLVLALVVVVGIVVAVFVVPTMDRLSPEGIEEFEARLLEVPQVHDVEVRNQVDGSGMNNALVVDVEGVADQDLTAAVEAVEGVQRAVDELTWFARKGLQASYSQVVGGGDLWLGSVLHREAHGEVSPRMRLAGAFAELGRGMDGFGNTTVGLPCDVSTTQPPETVAGAMVAQPSEGCELVFRHWNGDAGAIRVKMEPADGIDLPFMDAVSILGGDASELGIDANGVGVRVEWHDDEERYLAETVAAIQRWRDVGPDGSTLTDENGTYTLTDGRITGVPADTVQQAQRFDAIMAALGDMP